MRLKLLTILSVGLLSGTALAADLPEVIEPMEPVMAVEEAFSWTGFYIGANAGYATSGENGGDDCFRRSGIRIPGVGGEFVVGNGRERRFCFGNNNDQDGFFVGAQAGANYQVGLFVLGIEGDIQAANIENDDGRGDGDDGFDDKVFFVDDLGNRTEVGSIDTRFSRRNDAEINWFGTIRGRVGVAFDRVLLYGTGGFAFADLDRDRSGFVVVTARDGNGNAIVANRARFGNNNNDGGTEGGYVVGGGVEFAVTNNFTVKGEYQYLDFDGDDGDGDSFDFDEDFGRFNRDRDDDSGVDLHTVRVGANFKF